MPAGARGRSVVVVMDTILPRIEVYGYVVSMRVIDGCRCSGDERGRTCGSSVVVIGGAGGAGRGRPHLLKQEPGPVVLGAGDGPGAAVASWGRAVVLAVALRHRRSFAPTARAHRMEGPGPGPAAAQGTISWTSTWCRWPRSRRSPRSCGQGPCTGRGSPTARTRNPVLGPGAARVPGADRARGRARRGRAGPRGDRRVRDVHHVQPAGHQRSARGRRGCGAGFIRRPLPDVLGSQREGFAGRAPSRVVDTQGTRPRTRCCPWSSSRSPRRARR